jgi:hypothetical protein
MEPKRAFSELRRLPAAHGGALFAAVLVLPLFAGCSTHADRLREVRLQFYDGQVAAASAMLDRQLQRIGRKEDDVLKLDRAIVDLAAGRPHQAEQTLREVRDRFDFLEQKALGEMALAAATDDTQLSYPGEDYEKVLVRVFLCLSNLMHDGGDAAAYALQVSQKQQAIIDAGGPTPEENPKLSYKMLALGPYLHAALAEENPLESGTTRRCREVVCSWEPAFRDAVDDLHRAVYGRHSAPGCGVLYVFALVGKGPRKEEVAEVPTQMAMLIADRIISRTSKYSLTPTLAPVKVPAIVATVNRVACVQVQSGAAAGRTAAIADVTRMAIDQHQAVYHQILARAVARRAIKKASLYAAKDAMEVNPWISLAIDAGGVVWEATESADTRCWGLLPDQIQVLRLELPAGEHRVSLEPCDRDGPVGSRYDHRVEIVDGRNTYLLAHFPDTELVGNILSHTR